MIDFASNQLVADAILAVSDKNGAIGAVCHGVSAFVDVKDENGKSFIEGKKNHRLYKRRRGSRAADIKGSIFIGNKTS
ncbi:hypothetical protein BsIDN1_69210 [Bacillus safensis]|uniref:DJ-1/PfpI domain-containing protein n=1 Tax=Bacillus safensis TaxID=561879 RepID=A0A5S9MJP4_BACIA|nr:hypothetical protein BsIDN1_69210 [Bacillus safensis]